MGIKGRHAWAAISAVLWSAFSVAAGNDELWEMTMKMEMPGFAMPPTKTTYCQPRDAAYNPQNDKMPKNCEILDMKVVGNKSMWRMRCTGKESFEGSGEVARTGDTMSGSMKMVMNMGGKSTQMNQSYSARRIGACDAGAVKKKVEDDVAATRARMCEQIADADVRSGGLDARMPAAYSRKDQCPGSKETVCAQARQKLVSYEGYRAYSASKGWVADECGLNIEATRASLCQKATAEKDYGFMKQSCPTEMRALYDRNRALYDQNCQGFGRGYTADASHPNAALCRSLSNGLGAAPAAAGKSAAAGGSPAPAGGPPTATAAKVQRPARREASDEDTPRGGRESFHF